MADFNDPFMRNKDAAVQARTKAANRANVLQLKMMGQGHPTGLTPNLLKLFEARPPLEYKPPPEKKKCLPYAGMAQFVSHFAEPGDAEYAPPVKEGETKAQKKARIHKLKLEKGAAKSAEDLEKYDPSKDPNISGDPYKTLFVAKLSYETTEHRLKREFEAYGPIKRVRLITDKETNKPRGYAFIEYVHTRDMKTAYKQADGRKVDSKRVLVDVERGRTVPNWRPRRLGGGLGSTRVGGEEVNQKHSGRDQQIASGGPPRSEEPRIRDERRHERSRDRSRERGRDVEVREREKSREREREKPREREREKSRELSHDRARDRDPREDRQHRHHRDRERHRDGDRERDRGLDRDRVRSRDKERDRGRERDHDYPRERKRDRERDYADGRDAEYGHIEPIPARQKSYDDSMKHRHDDDYDRHPKPYGDYELIQPQALDEDMRDQDPVKRHKSDYNDHDLYGKLHHEGFQSGFVHADPEPREEGEAYEEYDNDYRRAE